MALCYAGRLLRTTQTVSGFDLISSTTEIVHGLVHGCGSGLVFVRHAPVSRPDAADPRRRSTAAGPHRNGHAFAFRRPDAFRPAQWIPASDDQEAAPALDHRRAPLVPSRRHQRPLAAGPQGEHLERMG